MGFLSSTTLFIFLTALVQHSCPKSIKLLNKATTLVGRMAVRAETPLVHSCDDLVFCQGTLLDTVQKHKLYSDSKTFVDMTQKNDPNVTLANFEKMMTDKLNSPTKSDVQTFVQENFEFVNETENWTPSDFVASPLFLTNILDADVKTFAKNLVSLWPLLGRKVTDSVKQYPNRHSLIPVNEGFIVPGGRFREIYYWDSYWIIKGLLISEMHQTVKGMLNNFIYFIQKYGFIPNGSRVYYVNRSHPPLFTLMVGLYLQYTDDLEWVTQNIAHIEKELQFWLDQRTLDIVKDGMSYKLSHYGTSSNTPRPESYAEDLETCSYCKTDAEKNECYNALKTAAETGWDFSTRWIFDLEGNPSANLSLIDSKRVIPVDLNALLCKSFRLLSQFYDRAGNETKKAQWASQADTWQNNIEMFLYNEQDGIWYDYDFNLNRQRKYFYASNFAPLWCDCYDLTKKNEHGQKAVDYFNKVGLSSFKGGIPASLDQSGEQWDLPNAWPPLQEFVVLGLDKTGNTEAVKLARELGKRWIEANMKGFEQTGAMYEKYDAINLGQYGGGGEYEVQLGFGWSNGVALSFIDKYGSGTSTALRAFTNVYLYFVIFFIGTFCANN
ncbi:trehalase-like [Anthonomus grandis grandis]|uniref:trehalase-like n=1 Tax=Anthonomus grandis grandis TaxID=2921223 RepID=UPI0021660800|nr:trehalase-like [Anthonomus grandis grandis]